MLIKVLGSAAGGGLSQWNCNCRNCMDARNATGALKARTQSSVAASGEERLSTLADQIALEPSSLSRILDVMRRNGWIETVTDPDDERARLVRMTDAGNALYAEAGPLWRKAQTRARKLLGRDDAEVFAELANRSLSRRAP